MPRQKRRKVFANEIAKKKDGVVKRKKLLQVNPVGLKICKKKLAVQKTAYHLLVVQK